MSKQEEATQLWESNRHMSNIELLLKQALNPMFPAGQAQAGLQLAYVEVPWLLEQIKELKAQNGTQALATTA
jgi:hypothetical protein